MGGGGPLWHQNAALPNLNTVFDNNEEKKEASSREPKIAPMKKLRPGVPKRFIQNQRHLLSQLFRPQNHQASNQKALKSNSFVSGKDRAERDPGARKSEGGHCI